MNKNEYQAHLVNGELIRKWKEITTQPAVTKFSRAALPDKTRLKLFKKEDLDNHLLDDIRLEEIEPRDISCDPSLIGIPGMQELAFLQRLQFPDHDILF